MTSTIDGGHGVAAATACAAAARDGDADAAFCVREIAKIGGPIANFIVLSLS